MLWHEQSWPELDRLDRELPVIIPLGACEQHGLHLPLAVDNIQVTQLAQRVESLRSDRVLLLPTLWLGSSHHHKDFPGTVSVPPSLYAQLIQQVARSILNAGFRRLFFLNGHGGNRSPAGDALTELVGVDDQADDAYLALASWWEVGGDDFPPRGPKFIQSVMGHACEFETSLMMVLRPDLVKPLDVEAHPVALSNTWFHSEDDSRKSVSVFRRFHRFTADGALGQHPSASIEKGHAIFESVVSHLTDFLDDFASWPALPPLGPPSTP